MLFRDFAYEVRSDGSIGLCAIAIRELDAPEERLLDSHYILKGSDASKRRSNKGFPPDPRVRRSLIFAKFDGGAVVGFRIGQKVVYPNHGIGTIEQIEQKQIGAIMLPFYTLRLAANNSLVLVPVPNASEVGLRAPISSGECELLLKTLADDFSAPANDWNRRYL
jgi:hypothetical protein